MDSLLGQSWKGELNATFAMPFLKTKAAQKTVTLRRQDANRGHHRELDSRNTKENGRTGRNLQTGRRRPLLS